MKLCQLPKRLKQASNFYPLLNLGKPTDVHLSSLARKGREEWQGEFFPFLETENNLEAI